MKPLLLILCLAFTASAQDWKPIKEMSGEIPNHPGLTAEVYAAQIARGDDLVKLAIRIDYPWGAPGDIFRQSVPWGTDPTSISRITGKIQFNCKTLIVKPVNEAGEVYQFNGKRFKSKEPAFTIESSSIFSQYFCEQPSVISGPPKLPTLKRPN